jgi:hypothetical protein
MMRNVIVALSLLCGAFTLTPAAASVQSALPAQGETVTGRIVLAGATVLLPPGPWIVGGVARAPAFEISGMDLLSVALLQAGADGVSSVVLVQRNGDLLPRRPDLSAECDPHASLFTATSADDAAGGACTAVMIARVNTQPDTAPAWREAAAFADDRGWTIPQSLLVAAFRTVDRNSLLDVRYATTLGEPGASIASTCSAIMAGMDEPAIRRRVNSVTRFANDLLPVMDLASGHGLDAIDAAPALSAPESPGPSLLTRIKLSRIDAMQRAGALTPAQADSLRAAMATQNTHDPLAAEIQRRSAWKTDTYQMAMATGSFGFWTYAAADPVFALGMVALQSVLITPINYAIEAGWSSIVPSLALSAHRVTLPSIGTPCRQ